VSARYDTIGRTYTRTRRGDPRIAAQIAAALGDARTIVNVGAGAGSYEPPGRFVVGVDPSLTMLHQRAGDTGPAVNAGAEALPFRDGSFDAALATLTLHHWDDVNGGLREMRRVSKRQVIFYFENSYSYDYWLVVDYRPEIARLPIERAAPGAERIATVLDVRAVETVPVPADCVDGFGGAYWNRPERYLDPDVQAGISSFAMNPDRRDEFSRRLRAELESGAWDRKYGHLRALDEIDLGYRILIAGD
jgi:SAM-dependent methyltransferase